MVKDKLILAKTSFIMIMLVTLLWTPYVQAMSVHRVNAGENLYYIAQRYGVTTNELTGLNHIEDPESIYENQILIIPDLKGPGLYRVVQGDTLLTIAEKLRVPLVVLVNTNHLQNINELLLNQPIYIPYRYAFPVKYKVKSDDTLARIGKEFSIDPEEIIFMNGIEDVNNLMSGEIIKIPVSKYPIAYSGPNYKKLFPDTFFLKGNTNSREIALTFDDGPDQEYTPQILDILKKYNVKATFFVMGSRAEKNPAILQRIIDEGHILASHTWSHINLVKLPEKRFDQEVNDTARVIYDLTGQEINMIRPPYGAVEQQVLTHLKALGYKVIHWSVDSQDWSDRDVNKIFINTLPAVRNDMIILFHSAGGKGQDLQPTVEALPDIIQTLRMEGFTFVNLDQLLSVSAYK